MSSAPPAKPTCLPVSPDVGAGDLLALSLQYLAGGLSLVPCSSQTKRPDNRLLPRDADGKPGWKPYQTHPADEQTVRGWFRCGCKTVAVVCGKVSGGLTIIDFDRGRLYHAWKDRVGALADGLPLQRTGNEEERHRHVQ